MSDNIEFNAERSLFNSANSNDPNETDLKQKNESYIMSSEFCTKTLSIVHEETFEISEDLESTTLSCFNINAGHKNSENTFLVNKTKKPLVLSSKENIFQEIEGSYDSDESLGILPNLLKSCSSFDEVFLLDTYKGNVDLNATITFPNGTEKLDCGEVFSNDSSCIVPNLLKNRSSCGNFLLDADKGNVDLNATTTFPNRTEKFDCGEISFCDNIVSGNADKVLSSMSTIPLFTNEVTGILSNDIPLCSESNIPKFAASTPIHEMNDSFVLDEVYTQSLAFNCENRDFENEPNSQFELASEYGSTTKVKMDNVKRCEDLIKDELINTEENILNTTFNIFITDHLNSTSHSDKFLCVIPKKFDITQTFHMQETGVNVTPENRNLLNITFKADQSLNSNLAENTIASIPINILDATVTYPKESDEELKAENLNTTYEKLDFKKESETINEASQPTKHCISNSNKEIKKIQIPSKLNSKKFTSVLKPLPIQEPKRKSQFNRKSNFRKSISGVSKTNIPHEDLLNKTMRRKSFAGSAYKSLATNDTFSRNFSRNKNPAQCSLKKIPNSHSFENMNSYSKSEFETIRNKEMKSLSEPKLKISLLNEAMNFNDKKEFSKENKSDLFNKTIVITQFNPEMGKTVIKTCSSMHVQKKSLSELNEIPSFKLQKKVISPIKTKGVFNIHAGTKAIQKPKFECASNKKTNSKNIPVYNSALPSFKQEMTKIQPSISSKKANFMKSTVSNIPKINEKQSIYKREFSVSEKKTNGKNAPISNSNILGKRQKSKVEFPVLSTKQNSKFPVSKDVEMDQKTQISRIPKKHGLSQNRVHSNIPSSSKHFNPSMPFSNRTPGTNLPVYGKTRFLTNNRS